MTAPMLYPKYFRPSGTADLIRIGAKFDGGYVLPQRILTASKGLLSFGLSDDCSFEAAFVKGANCPVVCFDHTVHTRFWISRTAGSFARAITQFEPKRFGYPKRWLEYKRLFDNSRNRHVQRPIGYGAAGSCTLAEAIDIARFDGPFFLKIDIEGWEYRVMDDLLSVTDQLTGLAIELHDIDLHECRIKSFLSSISQKMALVHFHPNSAMLLGRKGVSIIAELTFLNRRLLLDGERMNNFSLPIPGIDAPNAPDSSDPPFDFH